MSVNAAKLFVLVGEQFACVKIVGRATFSSSVDFRTVVTELARRGFRYFVLELSECPLMDSTFLGVLAGFGLKMNQQPGAAPAIELLNPNPRISELLENLGVLPLFTVKQGAAPEAGCAPPCLQEPGSASREEVVRACLEAHHTLMEIDPRNVAKFKDVTQFLAEDLKRLRAAS
jgi:anti-sigma B factor antagonist